MPSPFAVSPADETDIPAILDLLLPAFSSMPSEIVLGNVDTTAARAAASARHLQAWRTHAKHSDIPCAIKCTHTDPATGQQTIVACGEWFVYAQPQTPSQHEEVDALLSGNWVVDHGQREQVQRCLQPIFDARRKWLRGRPCAVLVYLAVAQEWRRKGVASMIVQWGVQKCEQLGAVAYLEASEAGRFVYEKCGFEVVDTVQTELDGEVSTCPAMLRWPPGTETGQKMPAVP
ncbi:hypothetical protein LTR53_005020 [Teratosphaeriaceae sp. CCFEE 6253]|nr:hypothetical protein LTR53_005020 [Teratosphaeriaceae sp. CCFEE 6253]